MAANLDFLEDGVQINISQKPMVLTAGAGGASAPDRWYGHLCDGYRPGKPRPDSARYVYPPGGVVPHGRRSDKLAAGRSIGR